MTLIGGTDINLSELQKTLDAQGVELVENQKESMVSRKALSERTKGVSVANIIMYADINSKTTDFRKIPDDEKLNAFKGLLKGIVHDACHNFP